MSVLVIWFNFSSSSYSFFVSSEEYFVAGFDTGLRATVRMLLNLGDRMFFWYFSRFDFFFCIVDNSMDLRGAATLIRPPVVALLT